MEVMGREGEVVAGLVAASVMVAEAMAAGRGVEVEVGALGVEVGVAMVVTVVVVGAVVGAAVVGVLERGVTRLALGTWVGTRVVEAPPVVVRRCR